MLCDFQPFKQLSAVLADVEEAFQHTHAQRLAEASRAGNKRHLCFFVQNFRNQTRFVNIIKSTIPNFLEIRNTDRDTQFLHLCCSFRVAMHRFLIASMIP